jgi:hypothetical protein
MRMATSDMSIRATPMVLCRQLPVQHLYVDSICPGADGFRRRQVGVEGQALGEKSERTATYVAKV